MSVRFAAVLLGLLMAVPAQASPPETMNYQGVLRDDLGAPVTGTQDVTFRVWDDEFAGSEVWAETVTVDAVGGVFEAVLGLTDPLSATLFDGPPLWLELQVGTEVLEPRQPLTSVPWALRAARADVADTATSADHATTADTATDLATPIPTGALVPIGAIIDYFAFDAGAPLPEGFEVCDGTTVADTDSPWFGMTKPDLIDQFVMGVATAGETGAAGGSNESDLSHGHSVGDHQHDLPSHDHVAPAHDHTMAHTHAGGSHTHDLNNHRHNGGEHSHSLSSHSHGGLSHTHGMDHLHEFPHTHPSHTHSGPSHRHQSSLFNTSENRWQVRDSGGGSVNLKQSIMDDNGSDDVVWARGASSNDLATYTWTASGTTGSTTPSSPSDANDDTSDARETGSDETQVNNTGSALTGNTGGPSNNTSGLGGTEQGSTPNTNVSGQGGTGSTGAASASSTGSDGAAATTSSSGTSELAGATTTGTAGSATHDNRPAWVGLLKLIRVR